MKADERDFGSRLEDDPPWMVLALLALAVFCLVTKYLL